MKELKHIVVIGGGAAGFFSAISAKHSSNETKVTVIEKHAALLSKVRVSGGGRCNVTNACLDPKLLIKNYPRGGRELLGPFFRFNPENTKSWFESRGVPLKTEPDGRVFPCSDSSQSIIDCLMQEVESLGIEVITSKKIESIEKVEGKYVIKMAETCIQADRLVLATGNSAQGHKWASQFGHTVVPPVPSLFTFNAPSSSLKELSGVSVENASVKIEGTRFTQTGPLLITHFGFSGPAVLKLSAWSARELFNDNYFFKIRINWVSEHTQEQVKERLVRLKEEAPKNLLNTRNVFSLPKKLWKNFLRRAGDLGEKQLSQLSKKEIQSLSEILHNDIFSVEGKTTNKEEFVTCGGIKLSEVNFKTMESKCSPGLYFAGEVLDIDGITGGFNFQNAWTTGYISGDSAAE